MNIHGWLSSSMILAMTLGSGGSRVACAQSPNYVQRHTSGWRPSPSSDSVGQSSEQSGSMAGQQPTPTSSPAPVQTAYFQAQGSLSDGLPAFPAAATSTSGNLPPAPAAAPFSLPSLPSSGAAPHLPQGTQQQPAYQPPAQQQPSQRQPAYQQPAYQSQSSERGADSRGGVPAQLASGELRSIQNERLPTQRETGSSSQVPSGQSTAAAPTPRLVAQNITTGYPFVTPPPRGRYATSPYQPAVFQTTYQTSTVPAQLASSQMAAQAAVTPPASVTPPATTPNAYLAQQQAALPQYRYPQPGIYPTGYQCTTPAPSFPSTGAVPGAYIPPTLPPNLTPGLYTPNNAGYTPLFSLGQENYNVQLGRGIIGQPTVYVPGQPIRNFMRYLSP